MLTPSQYDRLCDQLTALYAALDESIIEDITRRMLKTGRVTDTARWQAQQLQQAGMLYEDVLAEIAKRTDATQAHVRALFEDAGVQSIRNDNRFYKAAGLEGIVKMSDSALQTLNAGFVKCAGDLQNLTLTTANAAQEAYLNASNLAYMQVTTGTMDYNTAIRHAVQTAAAEGSFVLYPSGHRDRLDVAVRRAVLTGVGQTVRQLSLINAEDMGCDLMEITAHGGARPSHAAWQGKIVSRSGRRGYLSLKDIGYGTGDGFGGWNCRHDWFPFFEGISQRAYTEERLKELNEPHTVIGGKRYTDYEVTQMQRALERNIRKQKRQVAAANVLVTSAPDEAQRRAAQADFTAQSVKLKAAEQELKDFCKQTGFLPDTSRAWVNGFGRSVSQKAVHANKKALTSGAKSGIIKTGRQRHIDNVDAVSGMHTAAGNRRSPLYELEEHEIAEIRDEIIAIGANPDDFVFNSKVTKGTCFLPSDGKVHIRGNILPDESSKHPRDRMSVRAVLAHEYYGHRPYREQYIREDNDTSPDAINRIMARQWADEFRASYMAAKNAPNLSDEDRYLLICDALSRAEEAGVSIKYNDFIRRVLYG